jgi:FADH2 O2-dependent halogenase
MNKNQRFDIAVVGAGFSGSLTALGLHQIGYNVVLIEKNSHPRFSIGESSTPIADLILRNLSERYNLPWLHDLSRYGSWQQTHPEIACGLKRGFSYYKHEAGQPFQTDDSHQNELLVAASANNRQSDTNWFRSDVDAFFVEKVKESGIIYWDNTRISTLDRERDRWRITAELSNRNIELECYWLIDATGSGAILKLLDVSSASNFLTDTSAIFSHFSNVKPWQKWLSENKIPIGDYPYNPDDSALHHLLDEGWLWMLRFNNGITSCGLVFSKSERIQRPDMDGSWSEILQKYPSLKELFKDAKLVDEPGQIIKTNRLQRRAEKAAGDRWVALPHTAGFVDPLHSTGIAHSLSGVERILHAFEVGRDDPAAIDSLFQKYQNAVFNELDFIDLLVDGCYQAIHNFELFNIYTMFYFVATINYEQNRINGDFKIGSDQFLSANHNKIREIVERFYDDLLEMLQNESLEEQDIKAFRNAVKEAIEPYNVAGLLDPEIPNMYYHTIAEF